MKTLLLTTITILLFSCSPSSNKLKIGTWRGIISMQNQELPFGMDVQKENGQYKIIILNAEERLQLNEVSIDGDSVRIVMHIFDSEIRAKIEGNNLNGYFIKNYALDSKLPFSAVYGETSRYTTTKTATVNFSGKYSITFSANSESYPAVGIFNQTANEVTGTFLTSTGDYRYLQGNVVGDTLLLSTFDGNHAFVFTAQLKGDSITGSFYSGKKGFETWSGIKNENAQPPDAETLTYLNPGFESIDFSFPDLEGKTVNSSDSRFKNKVLILQIFGTWCPNCMDETQFLSEWYKRNKKRGIEILGLAYERKADFSYAAGRVQKMKERLGVEYDFVIAGTHEKEKASATLPALNKVLAFPTTIFIGKDGRVKYIHTGFSGPATGVYHTQYRERFYQIIDTLIKEG